MEWSSSLNPFEGQSFFSSIVLINGIFKTIKKGSVYIDNTTASATIAREIHEKEKYEEKKSIRVEGNWSRRVEQEKNT